MFSRIAIPLFCSIALIGGCAKSDSGILPVQLTLDWKPEPEFGGFYAARQDGAFSRHGLDVHIQSAGEGADRGNSSPREKPSLRLPRPTRS